MLSLCRGRIAPEAFNRSSGIENPASGRNGHPGGIAGRLIHLPCRQRAGEATGAGSASQPDGRFRSEVFDSFRDVPAAWSEICGNDLAMDLQVLDVFQRTLSDQCRCWAVVVYDGQGVAAGCAALCLFQTEIVESGHPAVVRWRDRVRRFFPKLGLMPVLFCGLPVPSGESHLRVRAGASADAVVAEIVQAMQELARRTGAWLTVFKELDDFSPFAASLSRRGYVRGAIPPMHLLDAAFPNFSAYRDALKSRYRAQVLRSQKKLAAAGFDALHGRGAAFLLSVFDDRTHSLYRAVQGRAKQKLELLPAEFFREMAIALGDEVLLTVIRRGQEVCAFTFAVTRGQCHYNMYSGVDYALNNDGDLYFNLFYQDLDQAWRAGADALHLGQTSDQFKSRLGTRTQPLWFYARARWTVANCLLRLFAPLAFPKVEEVEQHDVFKTPPPARGAAGKDSVASVAAA